MRHLLALSPWQPIDYIATDTGIPEQTIRTWIRRYQLDTRYMQGRIMVERHTIDRYLLKRKTSG
jgi:hypothetical protein